MQDTPSWRLEKPDFEKKVTQEKDVAKNIETLGRIQMGFNESCSAFYYPCYLGIKMVCMKSNEVFSVKSDSRRCWKSRKAG
jgi:hypothetical protein